MKNFFKRSKVLAEQATLPPERKRAIRERLLHFITAGESVRADDLSRHGMQRSFINQLFLKTMPIFAVLAIVALVSGGTSFAAQSALPGDFLYPFKLQVNEAVHGIFAVSPQDRAAFAATRAEARLDEAERLAAESKLNGDAKTQVESNFARFAEEAKAKIEALPPEAKADAASHFEAALKAHSNILFALGVSATSSAAADVKDIKQKVEDRLNAVTAARADAEAQVGASAEANGANVAVAAEGKISAAENVIASVEKFAENKKAELSAEAFAEIKAKIGAAKDLVAQAKAKVVAKAYREAFALASEAMRTVEQARVEAQAESRVNVTIGAAGVSATSTNETKTEEKSEHAAPSGSNGSSGSGSSNGSGSGSSAGAQGSGSVNANAGAGGVNAGVQGSGSGNLNLGF